MTVIRLNDHRPKEPDDMDALVAYFRRAVDDLDVAIATDNEDEIDRLLTVVYDELLMELCSKVPANAAEQSARAEILIDFLGEDYGERSETIDHEPLVALLRSMVIPASSGGAA